MALLSQGGSCSEQAGPGPAVPAWACSEDIPLEFIPKPFFLCTCQNEAKRSQTFTQVDSICEADKQGHTPRGHLGFSTSPATSQLRMEGQGAEIGPWGCWCLGDALGEQGGACGVSQPFPDTSFIMGSPLLT